jgi:hypothetical protein
MKWIPEAESQKQFDELERETDLAVGAVTAKGAA